MRFRTGAAALAAAMGCILLSFPFAASADSLRDEIRQQARDDDVGNMYQSLSIFNGTPGISAANYYSDGLDLNTYKLPLASSLDPFESGLLRGTALYGELTLGYLYGHERFLSEFEDEDGTTVINADYRAFTGLAGLGLDVPLHDSLVLRPILLAGYSYVKNDADFSGAYAELMKEATRGILFDFDIHSVLLGGAAELGYDRRFADGLRLTGNLRYNHLVDIGFAASDSALEETGDFGVLTGGAELSGPTPVTFFGRELRWIGFTNGTGFVGQQSTALGFEYFFEIGGGVQLVDREVVQGLEGVSLRTSAIVGGNVTGWTIGLSLEF